jgi:hypothetical protein
MRMTRFISRGLKVQERRVPGDQLFDEKENEQGGPNLRWALSTGLLVQLEIREPERSHAGA